MFVDWLIHAGNNIHRIDDYDEWLVARPLSSTCSEDEQIVVVV
jgi:hypothetical protein